MSVAGEIGEIRGKCVVVTGASSGIGLAACEALAALGARLVLVGRNAEKTEAAAAKMRAAGAEARVELCDMSRLDDIRAMGARLRDGLGPVDVLVNNAGGIFTDRMSTADGHEMTFGVNHLGYFRTTHELLPLLRAAPAARVVTVASSAHQRARIDLQDLDLDRRGYSAWLAYANSKACNILFSLELARRLEGTSITANSLHPGVVATGFGQNTPGLLRSLVRFGAPFLSRPDDGAKTTLHLVTSPAVDGVSGRYFARSREADPKRHATNPGLARGLWVESEKLVGLTGEYGSPAG